MNPMKGILVFDIETVANPAMVPFVPPPDEVLPKQAPRNYKKEAAIQGWMTKETAKRRADYEKRLTNMPLDVDYAMVDAIGYRVVVGRDSFLAGVLLRSEGTTTLPGTTEADILRVFWKLASSASRLAGYNVIGFDLPIIVRRSWILDIKMASFRPRRYSSEEVIDAMQLLYNWGNGPGPRARSLKVVCEMYGIENPLPDLEGSQYAELPPDKRREYCGNDVRMTWELLQKMHLAYWR